MPRHRFQLDARTLALVLAVAGAWSTLGGCATAPPEDEYHPAWPAPPEAPRIVHRRTITRAAGLTRPSFFDAIGKLIVGENRQQLARPNGIAIDDDRHLYVTDQDLQGVHVFDLKSGKTRFIAQADDLYFVSPVGVAACGKLIAVSDSALNTVQLLTPKGKLVRRMEKPGGFQRPTGLAYDAARSELYVVDTLACEVCVFDLDGRLRRRFGAPGSDIEQFYYPTYIAVDGASRVYVTDSLNSRVQVLTADGRYQAHIGKLGDATGHLSVPKGVGVDGFGHIYVVDSYLSNVQIFDRAGQFLLHFGQTGEGNGDFRIPTGLAVSATNRIYVCDSENHRIHVFEYLGGANDEP